jgi:hypothetical protein
MIKIRTSMNQNEIGLTAAAKTQQYKISPKPVK